MTENNYESFESSAHLTAGCGQIFHLSLRWLPQLPQCLIPLAPSSQHTGYTEVNTVEPLHRSWLCLLIKGLWSVIQRAAKQASFTPDILTYSSWSNTGVNNSDDGHISFMLYVVSGLFRWCYIRCGSLARLIDTAKLKTVSLVTTTVLQCVLRLLLTTVRTRR